MKRASVLVTSGAVGALALSLVGCTVWTTSVTSPSSSSTGTASSADAAPSASVTRTPTPATWSYDAEREAALQAGIAAWTHPVPEGYTWPASWSDFPFHGGITGQQLAYLNAAGIYHCMMVGAAWEAYFTGDDPDASKRYAALADEFMPDDDAPLRVTRDDGTIEDGSLASASGRCQGFVGDLTD